MEDIPSGPPSGTTTADPTAAPATTSPTRGPRDTRQQWVCVTPEGPRTSCPPFRSDVHLRSAQYPEGRVVQCPSCRSTSVRFLTPGVDPEVNVPDDWSHPPGSLANQ